LVGILEKIRFESGYLKLFGSQSVRTRVTSRSHATSAPSYPDRACTPRRRDTPRSEAGAIATVHLRLMTRAGGLGRCHAASPHSPAGEPPSAIGCWAAARHDCLRAHAISPVGHDAQAKLPRRVVGPIKPLHFLSSHAPEQTPQSAVARH
jgi:hypothetical protein